MQHKHPNFWIRLGRSLVVGSPLLLGILTASPVFAQTTTTGTTLVNFSNYFYTTEQPDSKTVNVYAGRTALDCQSASPTSTCNTCSNFASLPIKGFSNDLTNFPDGLACNTVQIHPDLNFSVTIRSDQSASYPTNGCTTPIKGWIGTTVVQPSATTSYTAGGANQDIQATFKWGNICANVPGGAADCKKSFANQVFTVGFDKDCANNTAGPIEAGIKFQIAFRYVAGSDPMTFGCGSGVAAAYEGYCDFTVYPGDEKVFVYNSNAIQYAAGDLTGTATPTTADASGMKYAAVRLYYAQGGGHGTITTASPSTDIKIVEGKLDRGRVTGLTNGTTYAFLAANVDQAGNVSLFSDPDYVNNQIAMSDLASLGDTQAATPEKVYGILDGKECFIATAAYGSGDEGDVEILRQFRNHFLLSWEGGRQFVRLYYKVSPSIARTIAHDETLKMVVRGSLKPVVIAAETALNFGLAGLLALIAMSGAVFVLALRWLRTGRVAV